MEAIKLENISRQYGGKDVLSNLYLEFKPGMLTTIVGPSGCGKTTLLNILSGLDRDYTGTVSGVPEKKAYMFQENRLLPWLSVVENIKFVMQSAKSADIDYVLEMLELAPHRDKKASQLSGGMARRCALARALCYNAPLLLLDEPFNGLDRELKFRITERLKTYLDEKSVTSILVSHDMEAAEVMGGQIVALSCALNN